MAKPVSAASPIDDDDAADLSAQGPAPQPRPDPEPSPRPDAAPLDSAPLDSAPLDSAPLDSAPLDSARLDWLDERIREEYRDAADEPLPPRLLALLRRLRPSLH